MSENCTPNLDCTPIWTVRSTKISEHLWTVQSQKIATRRSDLKNSEIFVPVSDKVIFRTFWYVTA